VQYACFQSLSSGTPLPQHLNPPPINRMLFFEYRMGRRLLSGLEEATHRATCDKKGGVNHEDKVE